MSESQLVEWKRTRKKGWTGKKYEKYGICSQNYLSAFGKKLSGVIRKTAMAKKWKVSVVFAVF